MAAERPAPPEIILRPVDFWRLRAAASEAELARTRAMLAVERAEARQAALVDDLAKRYKFDPTQPIRVVDDRRCAISLLPATSAAPEK